MRLIFKTYPNICNFLNGDYVCAFISPVELFRKKLDLRSDQQTDWSFLKQRNGL